MPAIVPVTGNEIEEVEVELTPWKQAFSQQAMAQKPPAFFSTGGAVPVMEGYLPGAARNRLSINEGEHTETTRRQREASMKESTRRRESAAKGESRRFSFMSSSAEFAASALRSWPEPMPTTLPWWSRISSRIVHS